MIEQLFKKFLPLIITSIIVVISLVNTGFIELSDSITSNKITGNVLNTSNNLTNINQTSTKFFEETFGLDRTQSLILIGIIIAAGFIFFSKILGTFAKLAIVLLIITLALLLLKG